MNIKDYKPETAEQEIRRMLIEYITRKQMERKLGIEVEEPEYKGWVCRCMENFPD